MSKIFTNRSVDSVKNERLRRNLPNGDELKKDNIKKVRKLYGKEDKSPEKIADIMGMTQLNVIKIIRAAQDLNNKFKKVIYIE